MIVASLATILMDVLRGELLKGSNGLPLGVIAAKSLFADVTYLLTPEFRSGIFGLRNKTKYWLAALIAVCSGLALFAGPSAALLLIPQAYTDWPAGGARFSLVGTPESIWPSVLDLSSVGGDQCKAPSSDILPLEQLNMTSCVWSGYPTLQEWFRAAHLTSQISHIEIQDGIFGRSMILQYSSLSCAVYGLTYAACLYGNMLAGVWKDAIINARSATPWSLSKYANLQFRNRGGTTTSIKSEIPVVRTTCLTNDSVYFAEIVNEVNSLSQNCPYFRLIDSRLTIRYNLNTQRHTLTLLWPMEVPTALVLFWDKRTLGIAQTCL